MLLPDFSVEVNSGVNNVAGVDEAGCGPWAGPVVAAAIMFFDFSDAKKWHGINDSKKITAKKRELFFNKITSSNDLFYGIGIACVEEIDSLNIGKATTLAMQRAVNNLKKEPSLVLVDGIRKPDLGMMDIKMIKKGDSISLSIAAASIIAKVTRDNIMQELDKKHPQYGWKKNAGYGTAQHIKAINEFGITKEHRKSFAPIKKYITEAA